MYTISPPMLMISIGMQNADISPAVAGAAAPPGAQFALACNRLAGGRTPREELCLRSAEFDLAGGGRVES